MQTIPATPHHMSETFTRAIAAAVKNIGDEREKTLLRVIYASGYLNLTHPEVAELLRKLVYPTRPFPK